MRFLVTLALILFSLSSYAGKEIVHDLKIQFHPGEEIELDKAYYDLNGDRLAIDGRLLVGYEGGDIQGNIAYCEREFYKKGVELSLRTIEVDKAYRKFELVTQNTRLEDLKHVADVPCGRITAPVLKREAKSQIITVVANRNLILQVDDFTTIVFSLTYRYKET